MHCGGRQHAQHLRPMARVRNIVLSLVLLTATSPVLIGGDCSVGQSELQKNGLQGKISYRASENDTCSWTLLDKSITDNALVINMKSLTMSYMQNSERWCSGKLSIQGFAAFCEEPSWRCRVYAPPQMSCNIKMVHDQKIAPFFECEWKTVEYLPQKIIMESYKPYFKAFEIEYKFVHCGSEARSKEADNFQTTSGTVVEQSSVAKISAQNNNGDSDTCARTMTSLAVLVSLFAVMIVAAFVCILLQRRRIQQLNIERLEAIVRHSTYLRRADSLKPDVLKHDHEEDVPLSLSQLHSAGQPVGWTPRGGLLEEEKTDANEQLTPHEKDPEPAGSSVVVEEQSPSIGEEEPFIVGQDSSHIYARVHRHH